MTVPTSVSFRRSGSLGAGAFGLGGGGAAITGGDRGRRDGENSGRARVSCNDVRAMPHKGLPANELSCRARAGVVTRLTAARSRISSGACAVTSSNRGIVSARTSPQPARAASSSVATPQARRQALFRPCRFFAIAPHSLGRGSKPPGPRLAARRSTFTRSIVAKSRLVRPRGQPRHAIV